VHILLQRNGAFRFWEAECFKIDPTNKKIHCRSDVGTNIDRNGEFAVDYDYLIVSVGARPNTFNTPGVTENCHFLKLSTTEHKAFSAMNYPYINC
jgi:NADH:ubiquinone reductase (non-electrogenic)